MSVTINPFANQVSVNSTPVNITVSSPGGGSSGFVNPMTTAGDLIIATTGGSPTRLGIGIAQYALTSNGTTAVWSAIFQSPMTAVGDLILGGTAGAPSRLPIGGANTILTSNGTTATWQPPVQQPGVRDYWTPLPAASSYHVAGATGQSISTTAFYGGGYLLFIPFTVPRATTVTEMGLVVSGTTATNYLVGIYSDSSGYPGSLLTSPARFGTSAAGTYVYSTTSTNLSPGTLYWAAVWASTTNNIYGSYVIAMQSVLGFSAASGLSPNSFYTYNLGTGATSLPGTGPGAMYYASTTYIPAVLFNG